VGGTKARQDFEDKDTNSTMYFVTGFELCCEPIAENGFRSGRTAQEIQRKPRKTRSACTTGCPAWLPITVLLCYFFGSFTGANPVIDSKKQRHITHYSTTAITVALAHPYLQ
jgi:hypothetical protein